MPSLAEYEDWKTGLQRSSVGRANVVLSDAATVNPDQFAGDVALGKAFQLPPVIVTADRDGFAQKLQSKKNETILKSSPLLSSWLGIEDNAKLAHDDLDNLSWFEGFARGAKNTGRRAVARTQQMYDQYMLEHSVQRYQDRDESFGNILADERPSATTQSGEKIQGAVGFFDFLSAASRYVDAQYANLIGTDDAENAKGYADGLKEAMDAQGMAPKSEIAQDFEGEALKSGATAGETLKNIAVAAMDNPIGALSWALETAGESAPQLAAALGVTALTRNPAAGIAALGGGSYATERYTSPAEFLQEKGIDTSTPEGLNRLLTDPKLLQEANERGVIRGTIVAAFDMLSGGLAGRTLAATPVVDVVAQSVQQAISGALGEYSARVAAGQPVDWADIFAEGLAEIATAPVDMGIAGHELMRKRRAAKRAEETPATAEAIAQKARESKLRPRLDSKFSEWVNAAVSGSPVENVYVPAEAMQTYFQGALVNPEDFIAELPGASMEDFRLALDTGGDLKIPTGTYAAKIAGSEFDPFLRENMRFDPEGMTFSEAQAFNEQAEDALQEAYEEAERLRIEDEQHRSFEAEIYDTMVSRLRAAGRSTDVARNEALVYPAFYRAMAERSGNTIEDLMRMFPLPNVAGERPEGLQAKDVDEFTRTLAELRSRSQPKDDRASLLEFIANRGGINDPGGELAARDAEKVKRGNRTLKLKRGTAERVRGLFGMQGESGFGLDDVARAAIEAGYLQDDPVANAYRQAMEAGTEVPEIGTALLAAIDQELAGNAQFAEEPSRAVERARELDQIEEYLNRIGVSLDDSDDAIREAVQKDQEGEGRKYGQSARANTGSEAFKRWFGNSEVVDENGRPMPVFHGTRARFEAFSAAPKSSRRTAENDAQKGFFFSTSRAVAESYAADETMFERAASRFGRGGRVEEVYLSIQNPFAIDMRGGDYDERVFADTIDAAKDAGHDGVVIRNVKDDGFTGVGEASDIWIAFRPTQIKSVFNYGSFDGADARIYYQPDDDALAAENVVSEYARGNLTAMQARKQIKTMGWDVGPDGFRKKYDSVELISPNGESFRTYGQEMRGSISFPEAGTPLISLFEKANLSTFLHESGHYFLAVTQALASQDGAPADVVELYDTIKTWWRDNAADVARDAGNGVTADDVIASLDNGTTGDAAKDAAIDVGMQEQFARASEAYFMEGKAPNQELRSAFEKFRAWLLNLYKRVTGLGVNVSDDLRRVFDRMLATDEEIESASRSVDDEMAFQNAAEAGVSEDQFRALAKLHDQAQDEAKQKLLKEVMAPIQREREKWFKEEKAKAREEVERNINAQPVYRVWEWLGNRRWFGDGQPEDMPDMRMSKAILVDEYGEGVLKTLPRGRFTLYAVEDGLSPDEVAGWFGFASGDDMIRALEKAQPRKEAIEAETDRVMRERHGDVLKDGSVEEAALAAVHGDKRGQYLAAELKTLKALAGDTSADLTMQNAREIARRTLNRMSVRDAVNSRRYLAAERRAADDVIRLSRISTRERINAQNARRDVGTAARQGIRTDDAAALEKTNKAIERANEPTERANERVAQMVEAARKRLINHALYAESVKIADEVEKAERFVAKLSKRSTRDRLAGDYLDAIDEILERYDFRKLSLTRERKRGALLAYIQRMTEDGRANELAIPDYVLADARRVPYKQLQVEVLRGVIDTLKNIEHTARLKRKLIDAKRQRDLDVTVDGILDGFNGNIKGTPPTRAKSGRSPGKALGRGYLNLVKTADTILREIDGFKDGGATYEAIKAPVDEAHADLAVKRREAAEKFEELYSVYSRDERRKMARLMDIPELGGQFSKWDLISIALNLGNDGNFQRLTDKRVKGHFAPEQIEAAMNRLDERDADFVQSVWDFINSYWPQIEERERRITGVAPEKVQPRPVTIAGKQLKGGYYPLKYDAELSSLASDDESADLMKNMQGGRFGKAQTRNGHLKERGNSSGRPVLIDIGALHGHINQVIHDLALSEVVNNSWRVLQDQRVKSAFINAGMKSEFDTLEVWLQDVATGEMRAADVFNKLARRARSGFTVSKLAFNLSTVLLQVTGNVQSIVVVGKRNFARGAGDMFRYDSNPWRSINAAAEDVMAMSPFMRERQSTFQKDIYDILGDTRAGPSQGRVSTFMREVLAPLGFWMMQKAQFYLADMPTWFAGYRKAIAEGATETQAIARADRTVARAQGSGIFSDRSAIERGSLSRDMRQKDVVRLFTALGSYMFAKFNVAYEKTRQTDFRDPRAALIWASDMAMLFTVEALLYAMVHGDLPGDDDEDEAWATFLAKETALSAMGTLPFAREFSGALQGYGGGGAYGSIMETLARPFLQAGQGEVDPAFIRSLVDAGGLVFMLPSTQAKRMVDATWGEDNDDLSPMERVMKATVGN